MLLVILMAATLFTNALEHFGEKLGFSEGLTGSVFAAVATALPETVIPLMALFVGTSNPEVGTEIGVGAILGAPFMLSTLSISLMAFAVLPQRGLRGHFEPETTGLARDLNVFLVAFGVAALALYVPHEQKMVHMLLAIGLVSLYVVYVTLTVRASGRLVTCGCGSHCTTAEDPLLLTRIGLPNRFAVIIVQLLLGVILLLGGAKGFIVGVESGAQILGISALLLSLLIVPIATELPEKINSILWIRRRKDTLAFGNITGALVFQGTLLPAVGMVLTPWAPSKEVMASVALTLVGALWVRMMLARGRIKTWHLLFNTALYIAYLFLVL